MATATTTAPSAALDTHEEAEQTFATQEPRGPIVKTAIPGPVSQRAIKDLDRVFDTRSLNMIANYRKSFGN